MLRIRKHISKQLALLATPRDVSIHLDSWLRVRRQRAPRIKLAIRPVCVGWSDGPSAERAVSGIDIWRWRETGGELPFANVLLVGEGIVFRDELAGAEVCGLEESYRNYVRQSLPSILS
jgi:hypothetical protein